MTAKHQNIPVSYLTLFKDNKILVKWITKITNLIIK